MKQVQEEKIRNWVIFQKYYKSRKDKKVLEILEKMKSFQFWRSWKDGNFVAKVLNIIIL